MAQETSERVFFEIVNPSDAYTIDGTDKQAACAATVLLGDGKYGLEGDDCPDLPILLFGGCLGILEKWWQETFNGGFEDYLSANKPAIAAALDTVMIGSLRHRRVVEMAMEAIPDDDARQAFWEKTHDEVRSSMNDIGRRAKALAKALREPTP